MARMTDREIHEQLIYIMEDLLAELDEAIARGEEEHISRTDRKKGLIEQRIKFRKMYGDFPKRIDQKRR